MLVAPFKILFNLLLSVSFFLNFCAVGYFFLFHYQQVTNKIKNIFEKCLQVSKVCLSLSHNSKQTL